MNTIKMLLMASAFAFGIGQMAHADYTLEQLAELQRLIDLGDTALVLSFIQENPELLNGDDALAKALNDFIEQRSGLAGAVFGPALPNIEDIVESHGGPTVLASYSGSLSDFGS